MRFVYSEVGAVVAFCFMRERVQSHAVLQLDVLYHIRRRTGFPTSPDSLPDRNNALTDDVFCFQCVYPFVVSADECPSGGGLGLLIGIHKGITSCDKNDFLTEIAGASYPGSQIQIG